MDITRSEAIEVFEGLGFSDAAGWNRPRLQDALDNLHQRISKDQAIGERRLDNLLDELIFAGSSGNEIVIVSEDGQRLSKPKEPEAKPGETVLTEKEQQRYQEQQPLPARKNPQDHPKIITDFWESTARLNKNPPGLRRSRGRAYWAGWAWAGHSSKEGLTSAIVNEVEKLTTDSNRREAEFWLKGAWHILNGFRDRLEEIQRQQYEK